MGEERADIPDLVAGALELTGSGRVAVANRLAEIAGLPIPTQTATVDYLVNTLLAAVAYIPSQPVAWSWGEFHNGGTGPFGAMDRQSLVACALDLQLEQQIPRVSGEEGVLTPYQGLARNLMQATQRMLREVQERLEAAGVSPYGHAGLPREPSDS